MATAAVITPTVNPNSSHFQAVLKKASLVLYKSQTKCGSCNVMKYNSQFSGTLQCNHNICQSCMDGKMWTEARAGAKMIHCPVASCKATVDLTVLNVFNIKLWEFITAEDCSICFEKLLADNGRSPVVLTNCKHKFCTVCVTTWLKTNTEGTATSVKCLDKSCSHEIHLSDIKRQGEIFLQKIQRNMINNCLRSVPDYIQCPYCDNYSFKTANSCVDAICPYCDYSFCKECRLAAHPNISCENNSKKLTGPALRNYEDNIKTVHYITKNVKRCPKCTVLTQRNGGCSHMTCVRCKFEWCWLCGGKYQGKHTTTEVCPCPK